MTVCERRMAVRARNLPAARRLTPLLQRLATWPAGARCELGCPALEESSFAASEAGIFETSGNHRGKHARSRFLVAVMEEGLAAAAPRASDSMMSLAASLPLRSCWLHERSE
jgi:hypothetical protein